MEPSLISRLQRLHVLRARGGASAGGPRGRSMDALVHDLSHALEESSSSSYRRRRGWRRRSRSAGNINALTRTHSEDSSSSMGEAHLSTERQLSSVQVSDSDEMMSSAGILSHSRRAQRRRLAAAGLHLVESDSVNETFSPARLQRRKRKLKRMAVDSDVPQPSVSAAAAGGAAELTTASASGGLRRKRSRMQLGPAKENRCVGVVLGKRKFGQKESRSGAGGGAMLPPRCPSQDAEAMECSDHDRLHSDLVSSSSLSSGVESEEDGENPDLFTNDEGREGDDEQSDWYHEPSDEMSDPPVSLLLSTVKPSREIRAGRRRVRDRRPAFSIVSSLNDRISHFLQDPLQTELRLQTRGKAEEDQLGHLASLYSMRVRQEAPDVFSVLKTSRTTRGVLVESGHYWCSTGDSKRRRRAAPVFSVEPPGEVVSDLSDPTFCVPRPPWRAVVPPTIVETSLDGPPTLQSGSRPASGDGHTPVPESSSPQTTEEPLSPLNETEDL